MSYKRKTIDEYQLHIKYNGQWEEITASDNRKEVIQDKKAYLENDIYMQDIKIVKKRVKNATI